MTTGVITKNNLLEKLNIHLLEAHVEMTITDPVDAYLEDLYIRNPTLYVKLITVVLDYLESNIRKVQPDDRALVLARLIRSTPLNKAVANADLTGQALALISLENIPSERPPDTTAFAAAQGVYASNIIKNMFPKSSDRLEVLIDYTMYLQYLDVKLPNNIHVNEYASYVAKAALMSLNVIAHTSLTGYNRNCRPYLDLVDEQSMRVVGVDISTRKPKVVMQAVVKKNALFDTIILGNTFINSSAFIHPTYPQIKAMLISNAAIAFVGVSTTKKGHVTYYQCIDKTMILVSEQASCAINTILSSYTRGQLYA